MIDTPVRGFRPTVISAVLPATLATTRASRVVVSVTRAVPVSSVSACGADNWPVEVAPNPDKELSLPVHQIALVVKGIFLLENMKLDELATSGRVEHVEPFAIPERDDAQ